jgi:hypothetical protein
MAMESEAKGSGLSSMATTAKGAAFAAAPERKKSARKEYRFVFRRYQAMVKAKQASDSHAAASTQGDAAHRLWNPRISNCSTTRVAMDAVFIVMLPSINENPAIFYLDFMVWIRPFLWHQSASCPIIHA